MFPKSNKNYFEILQRQWTFLEYIAVRGLTLWTFFIKTGENQRRPGQIHPGQAGMENQAEGVGRGGLASKAASEVFAQTPPRQSGLHQGDQGVSRQTGLGQCQVWQLILFNLQFSFSTNALSRFPSAVFDGVQGPLRLA